MALGMFLSAYTVFKILPSGWYTAVKIIPAILTGILMHPVLTIISFSLISGY